MTKRELLQAVKEIREICGENNTREGCANCEFNKDHTDAFGCLFAEAVPEDWEVEVCEK